MDSAVLYALVPGGIVVHAGVTPGIQILPAASIRLSELTGKDKKLYGQMVRVRHVRGDEMVPLGEETPEDPFWADVYDGRVGHIWFGHVVFMGDRPKQFPHATGLDLGCVHGGRLAAAILREGEAPTYITVESLGGEYAPLRLAAEE